MLAPIVAIGAPFLENSHSRQIPALAGTTIEKSP